MLIFCLLFCFFSAHAQLSQSMPAQLQTEDSPHDQVHNLHGFYLTCVFQHAYGLLELRLIPFLWYTFLWCNPLLKCNAMPWTSEVFPRKPPSTSVNAVCVKGVSDEYLQRKGNTETQNWYSYQVVIPSSNNAVAGAQGTTDIVPCSAESSFSLGMYDRNIESSV